MRLVLHSTNEFKTIDGKSHRIWTTIGRGTVVVAYIDHIEVSPGARKADFDRDLKRVETEDTLLPLRPWKHRPRRESVAPGTFQPGRSDVMRGQQYWEMIADQLSAKGWSLGWVAYQARDFDGWKVDAHKNGQRHQVLAEEINTAFLELQVSVRDADR